MKLASVMIGLSAAGTLLLGMTVASEMSRELWLGMAGPVGVACAEWIAVGRTSRRTPHHLAGLLTGLLVVKMILFGAYVALPLAAGWVRPVPFVASFMAYFLAASTVEAVALCRVAAGIAATRGADLS